MTDTTEMYLDFPKDLVPRKGVIRELVDLWSQNTDADMGFLYASAVTLLTVVLGPGVKIAGGTNGMHLNLWILLIAPSTMGRKSTAMDFVTFHAKLLGLERGLFPRTTPEGLLSLADEQKRKTSPERFQNSGVLIYDELSMFTDSLGRDYMKGYANELLPAYDSLPFNTYSKSGGPIAGRFEGLSMLSGTQPKRLEISDSGLASGFLARWNYFFAVPEGRKKGLKVRRPPIDRVALDAVQGKLNKVRGCFVELNTEPDADIVFERWYLQEVNDTDPEDILAPFYQRNCDHVLKFAGVLAISEGQKTIGARHIGDAIRLILWERKNLRVFLARSKASPSEKLTRRLVEKLERGGGTVLRTKLLKDMNLSSVEVDRLVGPLIEKKRLVAEHYQTDGGVKTILYRRIGDWTNSDPSDYQRRFQVEIPASGQLLREVD